MSIFDTMLSLFFGNAVFMALAIIVVFILLVMFIKAQKYVIEGIALIAVYGLTEAAFIQKWVLFVVIAIVGLDIAKSIIEAFFS